MSEQKFIRRGVDDFFHDVEMRKTLNGAQQRNVPLSQLEHASGFQRPAQQRIADEGPTLNRFLLFSVILKAHVQH